MNADLKKGLDACETRLEMAHYYCRLMRIEAKPEVMQEVASYIIGRWPATSVQYILREAKKIYEVSTA